MRTLSSRLARAESFAKSSLVRNRFDHRHLTEEEWQTYCDEMAACKSTFINADIVGEQEWARIMQSIRNTPREQRR